jgi:hypothetical protein
MYYVLFILINNKTEYIFVVVELRLTLIILTLTLTPLLVYLAGMELN